MPVSNEVAWPPSISNGSAAGGVSTASYEYNPDGIRVSQTIDGQKREYVIDANNPTGYAQVLEERRDRDSDGTIEPNELTKSYNLGLDVIGQALLWDVPFTATGMKTHLYDGHGSVRALLTHVSSLLSIEGTKQLYAYDAYGNMLALPGYRPSPQTTLSSLLYSGEQTDRVTGLQYLRARYYNPTTGRFTSFDPFAGSIEDPLSLHKYLYGHDDPINRTDPSGEFWGLLYSLSRAGAAASVYTGAMGFITGGFVGAIDAYLEGGSVWEGGRNGALIGLGVGATLGFLSPFAALLLPVGVKVALLNFGAGASLFMGGYGAAESFSHGNKLQGMFRLGIGFLGAYSFRQAAIRTVNRPLNIGGEGEVEGAINLQPRSALGPNYRNARNSKTLGEMILEGKDFQIYNAKTGKLPYADNSVPKVYTNSVPVNRPYIDNPGISRSEIIRILKPGGQWIEDDVVIFTKPS